MDDFNLILYLPNKPDINKYKTKRVLKNLKGGEICEIIAFTGNHWRKIFSIFSKLSLGLNPTRSNTWQLYRDEVLLTSHGGEVIKFSKKLTKISDRTIHIVTGQNYSKQFDLSFDRFKKIDEEGRILNYQNIYMTPYFDYRQFPNVLIDILIGHIKDSRLKGISRD
jgi:hypothetical protein